MKTIDADKLKESIKKLGIKHGICYVMVLGLIDELSEEREDENKFTLDDIVEFVEWVNLHYRALEHTKSIKNVKDTNELFKLWLFKDERKPIVVNSSDIANPLNVAIKGDGTEKKAFEIIKYFESIGFENVFTCAGVGNRKGYFYGKCGIIKYNMELPEGYTEISLKEEEKVVSDNSKVNNYLLKRVEELETSEADLCKELTELKLKLKDLSK